MRADRLLSLLLLLQVHGRMTARDLSEQLEVSERTIYRDVVALSSAGVPIYAECGREGGFELLDSYRTRLTGLTSGEIQALFMLNIPQPLASLGVHQELRQAWLKLSASLPETWRSMEGQVRERFCLDSTWWDEGEGAVPHLQTLYRAVQQDRRVFLRYRPVPSVEMETLVDAYGLVAKAGVWYLVYSRSGQFHAQRVSALLDARLEGSTFQRCPDFHLEAFWQAYCEDRARSRTAYRVTLRAAPGFLPHLVWYLGGSVRERMAQAGPPDEQGWRTVDLSFESLEAARSTLLSFGRGVEVLAPRALRKSLVDYAEQIVGLYQEKA